MRGVRQREVSPERYRRLTLLALVAIALIIVTGSAVRLTGSGLGCPDWPACTEDRFVADWEYHAMVEFVNRIVTGITSASVVLAVLGSLLRTPRRRDLVLLSLGLVAGVLGQIVLGGLTVLFHLAPQLVMGHFLLSMVLLANAVVLNHRAGEPDGVARTSVGRSVPKFAKALVVGTAVAVFTGTIVTASGPHGGDEDVERLGFELPDVARIHGTTVVVVIALTLLTLWWTQKERSPQRIVRHGRAVLVALVIQAGIGYTQYFTGVPALLVGFHIAGATLVWIAVLKFLLEQSKPATTAAV